MAQHRAASTPLSAVRRDRHGRGLRGPLAPADTPLTLTRADQFDDLVRDAVDSLPPTVRARLAQVEFAVEDVPSLDDWPHDWVPMARAFAADVALPARVVIYRRPIETRGRTTLRRHLLIADVVAEQVAELLNTRPEEVDPGYGRSDTDLD